MGRDWLHAHNKYESKPQHKGHKKNPLHHSERHNYSKSADLLGLLGHNQVVVNAEGPILEIRPPNCLLL